MAFVTIDLPDIQLKELFVEAGLYGIHSHYPTVAVYAKSSNNTKFAFDTSVVHYETSSGIVVSSNVVCRIRKPRPDMPMVLRKKEAFGIFSLPCHLQPIRFTFLKETVKYLLLR